MTASDPNYLPKAPPPNTITLGLELQHKYFGRLQALSSSRTSFNLPVHSTSHVIFPSGKDCCNVKARACLQILSS